MKIPQFFIIPALALALAVPTITPQDAQAMPVPINKGVKKDERGNLAPNVDTRMGDDKDDKTGSDASFELRNNTSGSFTTDETGTLNNTSGSYTTQQGVGNNTTGGINSERR